MSTIKSVQFDPSIIWGWTKDAEDADGIAWIDELTDSNYLLLQQFFDHDCGLPIGDLNALRISCRGFANERGGGLITCELAEKMGIPLIRVLEKIPMQPHGMAYEGTIYVAGKISTIIFRIVCMERGMTGMRDTVVLSTCFGQGLVDIDPETNAMTGWTKDPYDPGGNYPAMPNLSEDEKYDIQFPDHPLSRCRALMRKLEASLQFDAAFVAEGRMGGVQQPMQVPVQQARAQQMPGPPRSNPPASVQQTPTPQVAAAIRDEDISALIAAAHDGDSQAQLALGKAYCDGKGVTASSEDGIFWLRKSAKAGCADAQHELGVHYDDGRIVDFDIAESERWHRMAAEQGHVISQVHLGCILGNQDRDEEAAQWFFRAAQEGPAQGSSLGLSNYGRCLLRGLGVQQNFAEAVKYLTAAVTLNPENEIALYLLACCYERGEGVAQDYKQAFSLFQRAATLNYGSAQYELAKCYLDAKGVNKDRNAALEWLDKAMRKGSKEATRLLNQLREEASAH